ncbi:MAG: hypothetical protein ACP5G1_03850 [Nanopusillaceae archaeon]
MDYGYFRYFIERIKQIEFVKRYYEYIVIILLDLILAVNFTRLGNIYGIDNNIFPYNYPVVAYKYLIYSLYSYYPWLNTLGSFSLGSFFINFPVFVFSNIIFSDTFFIFFLLLVGSIFLFKLVKEILIDNLSKDNVNNKVLFLSGILSVIFFALGNQSGGVTNTSLSIIYNYTFFPLLLYSIRKYFTSNDFIKSIIWLLILIPVFFIEFYVGIPVYALPLAILLLIFVLYYSIKGILSKKYLRVLLIFVLGGIFILIKFVEIFGVYNMFLNEDFIKVSFQYWIINAEYAGLELTIRGMNAYSGLPNQITYFFTFLIPIIYLSIFFTKNLRNKGEILFIISSILIFVFLYSMPNVPFSDFWKYLYFKFPIMADLRTPRIIIAPFLEFLMSIGIGLGSYIIINYFWNKKPKYKIAGTLIPFITIFGVSYTLLLYGSPATIHIPKEFISTVNYINEHSDYNSLVLVLPIFLTENGEKWYEGPSLFSIFLKPYPILGGYYYSLDQNWFNIVNNVYNNLYFGNISNSSTTYTINYFYLFNVEYIIVEKDAEAIYPLAYFNPNNDINYLYNGLNTYQNLGIIRLVYNNSLYEVYSTNVNSSLAFISYDYYSINDLLSSNNASLMLIPAKLIYISPIEYEITINPEYVNKTIYLYFMIPYTNGWILKNGKILNETNYYNYTLFEIIPYNSTLILYNQKIQDSTNKGLLEVFGIIILPLIISGILYKEKDKLSNKIKIKNW